MEKEKGKEKEKEKKKDLELEDFNNSNLFGNKEIKNDGEIEVESEMTNKKTSQKQKKTSTNSTNAEPIEPTEQRGFKKSKIKPKSFIFGTISMFYYLLKITFSIIGFILISFIAIQWIIDSYEKHDHFTTEFLRFIENPPIVSYVKRRLDKGDEFPDIYETNSKEEIIKAFSTNDLMIEMLKILHVSKLPCVSSFHLINEFKHNEKIPNILLLDAKTSTPNAIGKILEIFEKKGNINAFTFLKKLIGTTKISTQDYFWLFDPSIKAKGVLSDQLVYESMLYDWKSEIVTRTIQNSVIEVTAKTPVVINDELIFDKLPYQFENDLAYCVQFHVSEIEEFAKKNKKK
jgi:hypothetical protein